MKEITWTEIMQSEKLLNGELRVFLDNDEIRMGPVDTIKVNHTDVIVRCAWMAKSSDGGKTWSSIEATEVKIPQETEPLWLDEIKAVLIDNFNLSGEVYRISPEHTTIRLAEEPDDGTWQSPLCDND